MDKLLRPQLINGDELAHKIVTCIEAGLAVGLDDKELADQLARIAWIHHVDYSRAEMQS